MKIGKVEKRKLSLEDLVGVGKEKKNQGFDLIYIFADWIAPIGKVWLKKNEIFQLDQKITYQKKTGKTYRNNIVEIERFSTDLTTDLKGLALESGHKSRFYKDERLRPRFVQLYTEWIEKSVRRELADDVLVSRHEGQLSGFITVKKDNEIGSIGLIAVNGKLRGRGIGKELLIAAENWFMENRCKEITVVTQQENIQACYLYERSGFGIFRSQHLFHF